MSVTINNQIAFYDWQLKEMDASWKKYHTSQVLDLYNSNKLFIGRIWGYDEKRGVMILRFKKGRFPRLNEPLTISYPKASVGPLSHWNFSYGYFRESYVEQFSDCTPIYYLPNDLNDDFRFVGIKNVSLEFMQHIDSDLKAKAHAIIVLGEVDPPREYLVALKEFTKKNPLHPTLALAMGQIEFFNPQNIPHSLNLTENVLTLLNQSDTTVIQGPPGTGKTHLVADICNRYLQNTQRVCVAALTHKALMEVALKDGLKQKCKEHKVFKTNTSADETALIPELKNHNGTDPIPSGSLLLATYYSLSKLLLSNDSHRYFDLIVIEEASQAFLTTIAGFSNLAKKVLIVGDFMQLQPIVLNEQHALDIDRNIFTLIQGLKTLSTNNLENSYRLISSHRLSERSANQTGVFYNNTLQSLSNLKGLPVSKYFSQFLCPNGGTSVVHINRMDEGKTPVNAISLILKLIQEIQLYHPEKEIAVLSAFKKSVNAIIDSALDLKIKFKNLEINTVDRIQGVTVDVCVYLIPMSNTKFSYDENRFNVATSRAKHGTIIIAEDSISNRILLPKNVITYLEKTYKVKVDT